jgi:CHAD domain-containing protein
VKDAPSGDGPPRKVTLSPTETVAEAARKATVFGAEALMRNQAAAESGEVEPLHQLRVATRRLRASNELFSTAIYASQLKIFRRDLPWLGSEAGGVRECDVTSALIAARAAKIDGDLKEAVAPILEALKQRRNAEFAKLCGLLDSKRYRRLLAKLSNPALKKVGADRRLGLAAVRLIRPATHGAARLGKRLAADAPPLVFHKLRVRLKRLRYELEMIAPLGAKRHKKTLKRLEDLQELLGLYHDVTVAHAWLMSYAETSGAPPKTLLAAGALIQSLDRREGKLRRQCMRAWKKFERSDAIRDTLAEIRRAGKSSVMAAISPVVRADANPPGQPDDSHAESEPHPVSDHDSMDSQESHPTAEATP